MSFPIMNLPQSNINVVVYLRHLFRMLPTMMLALNLFNKLAPVRAVA
jgi:hypothetical protein